MFVPLFDPSYVFAVLFITGIFLALSLCVAAWASVLFYLIGKITQKWLQVILPIAVALVFIAGDLPFQAFLYTILGENDLFISGPLSFLFVIPFPFSTILAMGVIAPFPLIREHLTLKRPWYAIFAASTVAGTYVFFQLFIVAFGPHNETPQNLIGAQYIHSVTLFCQFFEAMVIAAAVFGVILFLKYAGRLVAGHRWKRGILFGITCSLLVLLPAAGVGGLAVFFWRILQKIPGRILRIGVAIAALLAIALAGTILSGIPGMGTIVDFAIITLVIMALAMLVPFLYLGSDIEKDWQPVILLVGAVAADIVLSLVAVAFDLGERLTSDPITIVTFAEGGIIFAACACLAGQYLVVHRKHPSSPAVGDEVL